MRNALIKISCLAIKCKYNKDECCLKDRIIISGDMTCDCFRYGDAINDVNAKSCKLFPDEPCEDCGICIDSEEY